MDLGGGGDLGDTSGLNALISQFQNDSQNKRKGKKDRGVNGTDEEDLSLTRAWLAIFENGITSTDKA
ncbi:hypothetical protein FRX31_012491 [Thalictrum thalictroides]|uniref:Uncharacterized protein n=1 Tax=Thalictrum thalictroides TaxID=46969 RepID=A0A7J6WP63_THATH|nr:hypothetical protein FRX31_012491 [Thalictrum thalictroides]